MFAASLEAPAAANPRRGRKWYFERLEVQTIKCNVTLIPRPGSRDIESCISPGRIRMAATLGVNFIDINVPLKINALAFQNALMSPSILMSHITRHLINSVMACLPVALQCTVHITRKAQLIASILIDDMFLKDMQCSLVGTSTLTYGSCLQKQWQAASGFS